MISHPDVLTTVAALRRAEQWLATLAGDSGLGVRTTRRAEAARQAVQAATTLLPTQESVIDLWATEVIGCHRLLDEVGVGQSQWPLAARMALLTYWMGTTPTNARLLAALQDAAGVVSQAEDGSDAESPLRLLAAELRAFLSWYSAPPADYHAPCVRVRVSGPAEVVEAPDWIEVVLISANEPTS